MLQSDHYTEIKYFVCLVVCSETGAGQVVFHK